MRRVWGTRCGLRCRQADAGVLWLLFSGQRESTALCKTCHRSGRILPLGGGGQASLFTAIFLRSHVVSALPLSPSWPGEAAARTRHAVAVARSMRARWPARVPSAKRLNTREGHVSIIAVSAPRPSTARLRCSIVSLHPSSTGIPSPFRAIRYHSLAGRPDTLPACLEVTCTSGNGIIQGVRHRELAVEGVQFHPESILTEHGKAMLANFLAVTDPRAPTTAVAAAGGAAGASAAAGATGASAAASGVSASGPKAVTEAPIHSVAGVAVPATA